MTTATTDKSAKAKKSTPNPVHTEWLAAIDYGAEEWQRPFAPGEWGALAAKAWGCSVDAALQRAIELLEAGRLEPVTEDQNYQLSFEFRAYGAPLRSDRRARLQGLQEALVKLATADSAQPFGTAMLYRDTELVLIAFGKLVPRNFELYPAPRAS